MKLSKLHRKYLHGGLLALLSFALISGLFLNGNLAKLEWQVDDLKSQLLRSDTHADKSIIILLVDEASIATLEPVVGRWPWPRSIWADVLEFLSMGGAQGVAFDILFTERAWDANQQHSEHDHALIEGTKSSGLVTHAMQLLHDPTNPSPNRALPPSIIKDFALKNPQGLHNSANNTHYLPFDGLYQNARSLGVVEFSPDSDGTYRRTRLFRDYLGDFYPVLSTAPLMERLEIKQVKQENRTLFLDDLVIPLDRNGNFQVNFYSHFETISVGSVLASLEQLRKGNIDVLYNDPRYVNPDMFADKTIFIGTSAVGLEDLKITPLESRWPGVFLHASIASNLINQDFITQVNRISVIISIFIFALLTVVFSINQTSILLQTGYPLLLASLVALSGIALQSLLSIQWDLVPPLLSIFGTWLLISGYLSATEGREKRRVRNMLSQYVSPAALNMVLDNYEKQAEAEIGKEEEMTVVFSDIRGFTSISESLCPAEVVSLLNTHLEAMTQVTFEHGGTMDKFIGDATMAFWGAPLPDKDHALHGVQTMIHMIRKLDDVNKILLEKGFPTIQIGVGGNTGRVILGNIGSSQKLDYTIIGDAVNLGARLESLTKQYHLKLLISEFTQAQVHDKIPCAAIDLVRVKGKTKPVKIYTPLADIADENVADMFALAEVCNQAFDAYHAQDFVAAQTLFASLPADPFEQFKALYAERCQAYLATPPPSDWDGVYTLTSK